MKEHKLVNGTLVREKHGITARCICGWVSVGHFSSFAASAAFQDHQEQAAEKVLQYPDWRSGDDEGPKP